MMNRLYAGIFPRCSIYIDSRMLKLPCIFQLWLIFNRNYRIYDTSPVSHCCHGGQKTGPEPRRLSLGSVSDPELGSSLSIAQGSMSCCSSASRS